MDAQNAAGSDKAKPPASPTRPAAHLGDDADKPSLKAPSKDSGCEGDGKLPAPLGDKTKPASKSPRDADDEPAAAADRDSDAETIVLPGKDGHSPSKARKVKHEDNSDVEDLSSHRKRRDTEPSKPTDRDRNSLINEGVGRKKPGRADRDSLRPDKPSKNHDGSSGLSSAPTSPPNHRRRPAPAHDSDSDADRKRSPKLSNKDRAKSTDQMVSHKRKASRAASDDEHAEERKAARRRRLEDRPDWLAAKEKSNASKDGKTASRDQRSASSKRSHDNNHNGRSASPPLRAHRRSISTQLPSNPANGLSYKKKRLPAPLRSTEYHSDESSASASPHPRNTKVRNLSTPATADSNLSPAKMPSSKKHVDAHGQTPLARACTKGEFDVAKQRLMERPEDIDFADYAGNTPLQSAAINGFDNIVKLLIDAGCNVDCVNDQKDTPLLDAVENGHVDVVKLLLAAGVNPRKANLEGQEPLDRIGDDDENAEEIRAALVEAKQRRAGTRKTSEDIHGDHGDGSSHGADDSPRHSPAPASHGRRPGNNRAQTTSNHHLYVNLDDKTLREAAKKGDEETVTRVLQVKDRCDDPEAMVVAARGGHEVVLQLLLALGGADPDPGPVPSLQREFATPMLAAIGQENLNVVKLLLDQAKFDPTRRFKGLTYYEIAERRQGTNWKEEEQILKDAYDAYDQKPQRDSKNKSPRRERARAQDRNVERPTARSTLKEEARTPRRIPLSPSRDAESKKKSIPRPAMSPKEKRRSQSFSQHEDQKSLKRGPGRPKKDDTSAPATASDREPSPNATQKVAQKPKKVDSDTAALSSEGETVKPRRKLVSKGELRGEREKQRRASMASNTSSLREPPSPRESRPDEPSDKAKEPLSEKYHDRTKALKRDESRERSVGDTTGKRHRSSVTPPHPGNGEKDGDAPAKRRRLDSEGKERRIRASESQDERKSSHKAKSAAGENDDRKARPQADEDSVPKGNGKLNSVSSKSSIQVKPEQVDVDMPDAPSAEEEAQARKEQEEAQHRAEVEAEAEALRKKAEAERQQREADEKKLEEEAKQREADKLKREEEEKRRKAEEEKKLAEEEARLKREAEEAKRREAERQAREKEEEHKRKQEEERRQREEEELLRKQQLEREAAEQARRLREDEERKEREIRERLKREEAERKRAAHEAEVRRMREEERQQRLAKLPPVLRWLDGCTNPQTPAIAKKFSRLSGVRYDTIRPETLGTAEGREQWVLNIQVALLLGIKDLELARFTAWDRVPVPDMAKQAIWMLERDRYALVGPDVTELGQEIQGFYADDEPLPRLHIKTMNRLRKESMPLWKKMDMFFVKASDLLYIIPSFPHLRGLELFIDYKELSQDPTDWMKKPKHFKHDPDAARYLGFGPGWKKYINGEFIREKLPWNCPMSSTPFPEKRVPRRGLQQVYPNDPDYAEICKEQGLGHLLTQNQNQKSPSLPNGVHPSPPMSHEEAAPDTAETTSPAGANGTH